jgi:hypothetical protein
MARQQGTTAVADCPPERTAGLDWCRVILELHDAQVKARDLIEEIQVEDFEAGSRLKPWSFQGYEGRQSDSIRFGVREGRMLWETSGERCQDTARRMRSSGGRASRVDLQQTLRFSAPQPQFGMRCLPRAATTLPRQLPSRTPVGLQWRSNGAWCGTAGRRTSSVYGRVYDKGTESGAAAPGLLWRVEIEAKHREAEALWRDHQEDLENPDWVASYSELRWRSLGCSLPLSKHGMRSVSVRRAAPAERSAGARLDWLTRSVRPTLPALARAVGWPRVYQALGIAPLTQGSDTHGDES